MKNMLKTLSIQLRDEFDPHNRQVRQEEELSTDDIKGEKYTTYFTGDKVLVYAIAGLTTPILTIEEASVEAYEFHCSIVSLAMPNVLAESYYSIVDFGLSEIAHRLCHKLLQERGQ